MNNDNAGHEIILENNKKLMQLKENTKNGRRVSGKKKKEENLIKDFILR